MSVLSIRHVLSGLVVLALSLVLAWSAAPAVAGLARVGPAIRVELGHQVLHREPGAIRRATVGDPGIADLVGDGKLLAGMLAKGEVLLIGRALGSTNLSLWLKGEEAPREYHLLVTAAPELADYGVAQVEAGELRVGEAGPVLRLSGSTPDLAAHAAALVSARASRPGAGGDGADRAVDASTLDVDPMVQTDIRIVEVSRRALKELGFNFIKSLRNTTVTVTPPGGLSGIASDPNSNISGGSFVVDSPNGFLPIASAFNLVYGNAGKGLLANLSILETNGLAYTLAEPSLVALSGQTASFLAGGEFPIPVAQGGADRSTITIVFKEFGVRLALTPTVLSARRIALKVAPEVSELDFNSAVQSATVSVPGLKVRRADTTIELGDGDSFVISGLVSSSLVDAVDKVPWLGDIPWLGVFFRSTRLDREDKELVMIVTPHLVRPLARGTELPPMPGAEFENYRPTAFRALVAEDGDFAGTRLQAGFED